MQPHFDYCCTVWGTCSKTHIDRLSRLQARFGRLILKDYESRSLDIIKKLKWMPVPDRIGYNTILLVYKSLNNMAPLNLQSLFRKANEKHHYSLRTVDVTLCLPKPRTEALKRSFEYHGAVLWNSLPRELRIPENLSMFKSCLKKHILNHGIMLTES